MMKRTEKMIRLLAVVSILSVGVMIWTLSAGGRGASFSPPPFDPRACAGNPRVPAELDHRELDARVFRAGVCGVVTVEENQAVVWLTNPVENEVWLRLRILDSEGNILGQTGLLRPGEYIRSVELEMIPEGDIPVVLKLMAYEPETYHSAGAATINTVLLAGQTARG